MSDLFGLEYFLVQKWSLKKKNNHFLNLERNEDDNIELDELRCRRITTTVTDKEAKRAYKLALKQIKDHYKSFIKPRIKELLFNISMSKKKSIVKRAYYNCLLKKGLPFDVINIILDHNLVELKCTHCGKKITKRSQIIRTRRV